MECTDLINPDTREIYAISEEPEGRPTQIVETTDDMYESFGIEPNKVNKVVVKAETEMNQQEYDLWIKEVKPSIMERCSGGTHDIG